MSPYAMFGQPRRARRGLRFIQRSAIITGNLSGAMADTGSCPTRTLVQYPSFSISSSSKPK